MWPFLFFPLGITVIDFKVLFKTMEFRQKKVCRKSLISSFYVLLHVLEENLRRLEGGHVVLGDLDCCVLGNVAGGFLLAGLDHEAAETAEIHVMAGCHRILNNFHKLLNCREDRCLLKAGATRNLVYDVCLCHFLDNFLFFSFSLSTATTAQLILIQPFNCLNGRNHTIIAHFAMQIS